MKKVIVKRLKRTAREMIDPIIECYYYRSTLAKTEGWKAHVVDKEIEDDYVIVPNINGDYQIFPTERMVLEACHQIGLTEVRFQLPV
jgi:hypothetical protein